LTIVESYDARSPPLALPRNSIASVGKILQSEHAERFECIVRRVYIRMTIVMMVTGSPALSRWGQPHMHSLVTRPFAPQIDSASALGSATCSVSIGLRPVVGNHCMSRIRRRGDTHEAAVISIDQELDFGTTTHLHQQEGNNQIESSCGWS
jgi:hypothetical protein